jgi:hypothetical protein
MDGRQVGSFLRIDGDRSCPYTVIDTSSICCYEYCATLLCDLPGWPQRKASLEKSGSRRHIISTGRSDP